MNTQAVNDNHVFTKADGDQYHNDNERKRRDLGLEFFNESSDLVKNNLDNNFLEKKLSNIDSIIIRNPTSDDELIKKKHVGDSIGYGYILRFNQTLEILLKVSVGNDTYNLNKNDKIKITDTTIKRTPNTGGYLLRNWVVRCNDKKIVMKNQISLNQRKQMVQQVTPEQQVYLQLVLVSCI